jgi:hypothetical protein
MTFVDHMARMPVSIRICGRLTAVLHREDPQLRVIIDTHLSLSAEMSFLREEVIDDARDSSTISVETSDNSILLPGFKE